MARCDKQNLTFEIIPSDKKETRPGFSHEIHMKGTPISSTKSVNRDYLFRVCTGLKST